MTLLRRVFYALPPSWRFFVRRLFFLPTDLLRPKRSKNGLLIPPKGLIYTGSGDFLQQGETWLKHFIEKGQLAPEHQVLDIGSGIGRIAIPLTTYLNEHGGYEGFDVVKMGVDWCQKHISRKFPNFRFQYIPIDNDLYRSEGLQAANYHFPYANEQFDFVVLTSVFTHMLPDEVENYLAEIHRVLKPNGRCMATFFIWSEAAARLSPSNPKFQFPFDHGHYRLMDEKVKSANVAFDDTYLENYLDKVGLRIENTFPGFWCGRPKADSLDFQDVLLLQK
ncbi:MAG: class I SAM-dependent methyltransferase [Saprospiraceae bacterium]|nr:class I SAM-dependent methyltransferase [Saprospiraceae bacterium]